MCNWFKFHKEYQRLMKEIIDACQVQDWNTNDKVRKEIEQLKIESSVPN